MSPKPSGLRSGVFFCAALFALAIPIRAQTIVYVDADAQGANTGGSWSDAFVDLQAGLTAAESGSEIWVAEGTYRPAGPGGDRNLSFKLKNGVGLYGGFAGNGSVLDPGGETQRSQRDVAAHVTILSGDLNGDDGPDWANNAENSYHVVIAEKTDSTAVIDGFTIRGGNADAPGGDPRGYGGGLASLWYPGGFTMGHCTIVGNSAYVDGGGVSAFGPTSESIRIVNCIIKDNRVTAVGGGGIAVAAKTTAGAIIAGCTISGNSALGPRGHGGGLYCFVGTTSSPEPDSVIVANCTFINNRATYAGGAVSCGIANDIAVVNCTLVDNFAPRGRSLDCDQYTYMGTSRARISNCILWDGPNALWANEGSTITVSYTNVKGGLAGEGNIWLEPMFLNPAGGDLRLAACSPCIDAGNNSAYPPGLAPLDHDGQPRLVDDPGVSDIGHGPAPVVDMGAFEFQDNTAPPAPAAPQNVLARKAPDCGAIRIAWDPSSGADGYVIHRSTENDLMTASVVGTCAAGPYDDFSAARRVQYWYWVTAVRGGCSSRFSNATSSVRFIPGDMDHDCDVDQEDFGKLQACLSGIGVPQDDTACVDARIDEDSDVDEIDLDIFLACLSGPGKPLPPACPGQLSE